MLTLADFEKYVDADIAQRGNIYYHRGLVRDITAISSDEYQAIVEGSEEYEVIVSLSGANDIADITCTCPYDFGPFCKHEVAVLYAIRSVKKVHKGTRVKTVTETLDEVLEKIPHVDLQQLVKSYACEDRRFRALLLRRYSTPTDQNPKKMYQRHIRECIHAAVDRYGYAQWRQAYSAMEGASELLDRAQDLSEQQKWEEVLPIAEAILEELYPAFQKVDDSNGDVGSIVEGAWDLLRAMAQTITPDSKIARELFDYCLDQADRDMYDGWYAQWDFYGIAAKLVQSDVREKKLFDAIDHMCAVENKKSKEYGEWHFQLIEEKAVAIKLKALEKNGKHVQAQKFIVEHVHIPEMREKLVQQAYEKKEYDTAQKLSSEGVALAQKSNLLRVERQFQKWLLTIAEANNDIATVRHYLQLFFYDRHEFEYYDKLQKTYKNNDEWQVALQQCIAKLKKNTHNVYPLLELYVREEYWEDFLHTIQESCTKPPQFSYHHDHALKLLKQYDQHLSAHFPGELFDLYADAVAMSLYNPLGREHYRYIATILRNMKSYAGGEKTDQLVAEFKKTYKRRRALLEELSAV